MRNILVVLLLFPMVFFAQEKQPKVGLVLSGGGAKGLAHIGILKEIDKAGLQIDYIGGTSMGAIIGGLYAAGYSGEQIEKIVNSINLQDILQDVLPRNSKPYFEKEFGEKHAIMLPVNKKGIGLPRAVSKGQNVLNLFNYILSHVDTITDFKKLPIPFFCVATDAETGKMVLLENGSLPLALRSSGSFPTLLNPVEMKGHLLLDGGIANNFPSDIMKTKGVDIIIGVDVQSELIKRDRLNSVITILNQIVSYDIYEQSKKGREDCDVYIKPDISAFTVVDFDKSKGIMKQGHIAGKKYSSTFDSIAKLQSERKKRPVLVKEDNPFVIEEIKVFGTENYTPAYVRGKLKIRIGDEINRKELNKRISFLASTDNYDRIDYKVIGNKLHFYVIENKQQSNVRLGAHYDELYQSAILANYTHKRLLIKNDELSLDMIVGDRIRYNLNYFVDNGFYTSYGLKSRYNHFKTNTPFSTDDNPNINEIDLNYTDFTNEIFLQTTFSRKFALGFGAEFKKLKITTETLSSQTSSKTTFDNSNYINFSSYLKLDTYDDRSFPTRGFYADVGAKWYAWSSDYLNNFKPFVQLGGRLGFATTFWDTITFQYTNDAGFTFENPTSTVFDFYLGGYNQNYINTFKPFYGYEFAEISDKSFLRSEFLLRYKVASNHYATFIANYARVDGNVFSDGRDLFEDVLSGYALGYSIDTILGPIEIKYSWSPENNNKHWLFNLGFWF
ncbi:patatin-like phospholipase family protein [Pseudotenacibaculum sp. MALMAid0570]|uniref:patatin-like phospholipase family protein n=1 Tax=Pseudotenacibaculum sp. MALMAid0570 TaxID=3143938 RepID=UPI0032DFBBD5